MTTRDRSVMGRLGNLGSVPGDDEDQRLRKALLIYGSTIYALLGVLWGLSYYALGLTLSGSIPLGYGLVTAANLILVNRLKAFSMFQFVQLLMWLVLPFLLQWSLGGFINSGAVMIWAFAAPMGGLMFSGVRVATRWTVAYLVLTLISGVLDPYFAQRGPHLSTLLVVGAFVLNIASVSAVTYGLLRYFVAEREKAQARSEQLLLNVLPAPIAERLKRAPGVIADRFNDVSILFVDVVDFTPRSLGSAPDEVVQMLNNLFSAFDTLAERHGLEKIKTIGDAYMLAGGVPVPRTDHAEAVAEMALDMLEAMRSQPPVWGDGQPVRVRIGINSGGPVVAAVIGRKKFIYDVWGDVVNTASRMESHGLAGAIQVSEETYQRLKDRYEFERRGVVEVKGKGEMITYLLRGKKAAMLA